MQAVPTSLSSGLFPPPRSPPVLVAVKFVRLLPKPQVNQAKELTKVKNND